MADTDLPVPPFLVGDNSPSVYPLDDPAVFGTATLSPCDPVPVRSFQSFTLTYTVGSLGIDDTGGIRIAWRTVGDTGRLQDSDPQAANYVTAESNGEGRLSLSYYRSGGQRPWGEILTITQHGGYLRPGDIITIHIGDRRQGSPGLLIQTFAEAGRDFRVMADVQATGNFYPLPDCQLYVPVIAAEPALWKAVIPSIRKPGEPFFLGIKAEDSWGNPAIPDAGKLTLVPSRPVKNLPQEIIFDGVSQIGLMEGLSVPAGDLLTISVMKDGQLVAEAGPLCITEGEFSGYWGDLHGQSGETVGIGRIEDYMSFARNKAFLEVTSHQGNDFQIKDVFWDHLNTITEDWNEPGRFTVFPGYEWSGNTAIGGDRNVIYANEGGGLHRCSHALIEDRHDIGNDAPTLTDLYAAINDGGDDTVIFAHVGGRYANIEYDFDASLETAVEIHSDWGTFEWIAHDSFKLGRRIGIVANSDGHKGRPGASYPGISEFGAYGGLTCFLAKDNSRKALFDCIRRRHHYATTGCRIVLSVTADFDTEAMIYHRDPASIDDPQHHLSHQAMMGDIVQVNANDAEVNVSVHAHAGIERIELRDGAEVIETFRPYDNHDLGNRIRVLWTGAEYRGRGRNTLWQGEINTGAASIKGTLPINRWNPERLFEQQGHHDFVWESVTTGNFMGVDLHLDHLETTMTIRTNHGDMQIDPAKLGLDDQILTCGGLGRALQVNRLPDTALPRSMSIKHRVNLHSDRDTPFWVCVVTEDGHKAWSSPIYFIRDEVT